MEGERGEDGAFKEIVKMSINAIWKKTHKSTQFGFDDWFLVSW